jgi:hypothetical protein
MDILVTCGAGGSADLPQVNDAEAFKVALQTGRPFLVPVGS